MISRDGSATWGVETFPALSQGTVACFRDALPSLQTHVEHALRLHLSPSSVRVLRSDGFRFLIDQQAHFGRTLAAVYAFGLHEALADDMVWMANCLKSRGLDAEALRQMLTFWIIALQGTVCTSFVHELIPPLEWAASHSSRFFSMPFPSSSSASPEAVAFTDALFENRNDDAVRILKSFDRSAFPDAALEGLVFPALAEIGQRWCENRISVADEHLATANSRRAVLSWLDGFKRKPDSKAAVSVACVPGDEHALISEMLARYLAIHGWRVFYLGQSMPEQDLIRAVEANRSECLFLTLSLVGFLPALQQLFLQLHRRLPECRTYVRTGLHRVEPALARLCDGMAGSFDACHRLLTQKGAVHA